MSMTVFYRKSTGDLTEVIQGEQTFDIYGDLKADYQLIYDSIIVDYDEYIIKNSRLFYISDGLIKVKDSEALQKYL